MEELQTEDDIQYFTNLHFITEQLVGKQATGGNVQIIMKVSHTVNIAGGILRESTGGRSGKFIPASALQRCSDCCSFHAQGLCSAVQNPTYSITYRSEGTHLFSDFHCVSS